MKISPALKLIIVVFIVAFLTTPLSCRNSDPVVWQKTFGGDGGDSASSIQQTSDNGYIIVGTSSSWNEGNLDVYLIKIDDQGNELWSRTFGGEGGESASSIQQTADGGYIIAGTSQPYYSDEADIYLIKTDKNGREVWSRTFGNESINNACTVRQTADGGFIILGDTFCSNTHNDIWLIKLDVFGNELWSYTYGSPYNDRPGSIELTSGGGYIIVGSVATAFGGDPELDIYLVKTDEAGNELWSKTYGGSDQDTGESVQPTSDGGYIIAGHTESPEFNTSLLDICLIKTDSEGNEVWFKTFGGEYNDYSAAVRQTNDNGYAVLGTTDVDRPEDPRVLSDIYLIKTDENGNKVWTRTYGGSSREDGSAMELTDDGGFIIAGLTVSYRGENPAESDFYNAYVIKTDTEGNTAAW